MTEKLMVTLRDSIQIPNGAMLKFFQKADGWAVSFDHVTQLVTVAKDGVVREIPQSNVLTMAPVQAAKK